jgi:ubiquinone/menaquinone biosynthesis C-methylase UbiE
MNYYSQVGAYYDRDATDFEQRYWHNSALQRIRQSFREVVKQHPMHRVLEVGVGPGFDLAHFASQFPQSHFFGLDVSEEMVKLTAQRIRDRQLVNAQVAQGSAEDLERAFPNQTFDLIYVFFGALNTVEDLQVAMTALTNRLEPGGKMVLTFVNKWYLAGMVLELLKLKPKRAFARLKKVWGGYSPTQFLASRCYSPAEIATCAQSLRLEHAEGFSIAFPAWYYRRWHTLIPTKGLNLLWRFDRTIARTKMGTWGEYMLYTFAKP